MSKTDNLKDFLTDIADAVREKKGTSDPINAQNLSSEIRSISGGGSGSIDTTSKYKISLPNNFGVMCQKQGTATSDEWFNFENLPIINLVCKFIQSGNIFAYGGDLLALRCDLNNYLTFALVNGYDLRLQLVVNGVVTHEQKFGQPDDIWIALITSVNWLLTFDYVRKRFVVITKGVTASNNTFVFDLSEWELEQLGEFKVTTEVGKVYAPILASKFFVFNNYVDSDVFLNTPPTADNYQPFGVSQLGTICDYNNLKLKVDGTIVETISPTHVVSSYSRDAEGYFAMGCYANENFKEGAFFAVRVRFREIDAETTIVAAAGSLGFFVLDDDLNFIARSGSKFYPEANKWYTIVNRTVKNGAQYSALYAFYLKGSGVVEVQALYQAYERRAAICSLNWDGEYFTGYIPFKGDNIEFEKIDAHLYPNPPLYTLKEENGKISMWNGSAWKQISNA